MLSPLPDPHYPWGNGVYPYAGTTANYTLPTGHTASPSQSHWKPDQWGYIPNRGYTLYARDLKTEMLGTQDAYNETLASWIDNNNVAKWWMSKDAEEMTPNFRSQLLYGMANDVGGTTFLNNVPTNADQREKLVELAAKAKALYEDPEIDVSQNTQYAAGMSAAMGGGHNAATAIKDNISFEQKLEAKKVALQAYTQALDAYFKTYTSTAVQMGSDINKSALVAATSVPTVVPFESQLAGDVYSNWQDIKNTGQMRDQQIRQTYNGAKAMLSYYKKTDAWIEQNSWNWYPETTATVLGIRSQYHAAASF